MMITRLGCSALLMLVACLGFIGTATAGEKAIQFEATLVWGTNDPQPSDPKLSAVPPLVERKLGKLPFKWKYYYAVERKTFSVESGQHQKVRMSQDCEIDVKAVDHETVELALRGKGQRVGKLTQKLAKDELLVTGGNAENFTAWFVVLRRLD